MGTYTVARIVRPFNRAMFADLGIPVVELNEQTVDGQIVYTVTCPDPLPPGALRAIRIRLMTRNADEERLVSAAFGMFAELGDIRDRALAYAAIASPTQAQVVAATQQLARGVAALAVDLRQVVECVAWYAADA